MNIKLILFKRKDSVINHDKLLDKFKLDDNSFYIHEIENDYVNFGDTEISLNYLEVNNISDNDLIIFLDEKATTSIGKIELYDLLNEISNNLSYYDIFYLANFMDDCNTIKEIKTLQEDIKFYESYSPNGFYCVVTNFKNWKKISNIISKKNFTTVSEKLSESVLKNEIKAGTVWPRVFVPNIENFSNKYENFLTYPCKYESVIKNTQEKNQRLSSYWFISGSLIAIIFLIIYYNLIKFY